MNFRSLFVRPNRTLARARRRDAVGIERLQIAKCCKVAWLAVLSLSAGTPAQQPSDSARSAVREFLADRHADPDPVMREDLRLLSSGDVGQRTGAADHLLALLVEVSADARLPASGTERDVQQWWSARKLRLDVVHALADRPVTGDTRPLLVWSWHHGEEGEVRAIAARALNAVQTPEVDRLFLAMVTDGCTVPSACLMALDRIDRRQLPVDPEAVLRLCDHFHAGVRSQARAMAVKLGLHPHEYDPARSLGQDLERLLAFVGGLTAEPVPADAPWGRLHFPPTCFIRPAKAYDLEGWLLQRGKDDQPWRFLTSFGEVQMLAVSRIFTYEPHDREIDFTPSSLADAAQLLGADRDRFERTDDFRTKFQIAWDQGLLRERLPFPEHWCGSASEWFVAAWLFARGDRAGAGLLLPPLQDVVDLRDYLRPLLERAARQLSAAMLITFADDADYGHALALARKLAAPELAGVIDQELAKELLEQLSRRQDDFRALQLPTPAEWRQERQALSRVQQIGYLAARLRLLRCGEICDNLLASYASARCCDPPVRRDLQPAGGERINPWTELLRMNLTAGELPALLPALESRDFILGYCGRTEAPHWLQGLHRVAAVAASICNQVLQQTLVDPALLPCENADARQRLRRDLLEHAAQHGVERCSERLAEQMQKAGDFEDVQAAFWNLHGFDPVRAVELVREVGRRMPGHMPQVVRLLVLLDRSEYLGEARDWLHSDTADVRFFAAVLLLRHRQEAGAALAVVRERLGQYGGDQLVGAAVDALLACGLPGGEALLVELLAGGSGYAPTTAFVQRLLRAGKVEAFTALQRAICGEPGLPRRPDKYSWRFLLMQLGAWWPDVDVSALVDEKSPAEAVAAVLGRRLAEDWQRILRGERPAMRIEELPLPWDGLQSFAHGWIWNPR